MSWWRPNRKRRIGYGACSDVGMVRSENQDAYGRFPRHATSDAADQLFVVADGMGGHVRGQEASRTAVHVVQETYFSAAGRAVTERLRRAFEAANAGIYKRAHNGEQHDKMGTTCTVLALSENRLYLGHVGDSRAYRINRRGIEQLSHDHTLVEELLREGILTEKEALMHPRRNTLTRAMGVTPNIQVDLAQVGPIQAGDNFLLCTDGLANVSTRELQQVVLSDSPQRACEKLVEMANDRGGHDNVTVMIVRID